MDPAVNKIPLLKSFRTRITLILIFCMLFAGTASNLLLARYAMKTQFNQIRYQLMMLASTASLLLDADMIMQIPLNKEGMQTPQYKSIVEKLAGIRDSVSSITYIYIMRNTFKKGVLQFIVDPDAEVNVAEGKETSYPGDEYDAWRFPQMIAGLDGPAADKRLQKDEWGVFLSGYAPIRDSSGKAVALLGVDMAADDVFKVQQDINRLSVLLLIIGLLLSLTLGIVISEKVTRPIGRLVAGTRHIAAGELDYKVEVKGKDEISELAGAFNRMSLDLQKHMEQLRRTTAEKERFEKELEIAKGIQQSFLPDTAPDMERFEIVAISIPAREVGGDFYDFIPIDKDRWGLAVADVSGKGVPAALFMALSRTLIRASTSSDPSVKDAISHANRLICADSKTNMFVTLFYAILDSNNTTLQYINAGHNPPLLLREEPGDVVLLKAEGIPLGLFPDIDLPIEEVKLKKGDVLVLYTDGVTEAINAKREQFETERLSRVVRKNHHLPAQAIIKAIQAELKAFVCDQPQYDDITLVILKVS